MSLVQKNYRISGHESFPCRYTWLPKAVRGLRINPKLFLDDHQAMVDLGVGKNMVRSIRFWSQVTGMSGTGPKGTGHLLTHLGVALLGERGLDPFLEDVRTLWLIHWNLSSEIVSPLLAWDYLLNRWQQPELVPSVVVEELHKEAAKKEEALSRATIEQHFETFLHTYVPTRGRKGEVQEDNLDCPLVELELIMRVGERSLDRTDGRSEPVYAFRREEKPDITSELFVYCLNDFWNRRHDVDSILTFGQIAYGHGGPGQIFKLPEEDVRARADRLESQTKGLFKYTESASLQRVHRQRKTPSIELLKAVYETEVDDG
jgi:hypothetical protein